MRILQDGIIVGVDGTGLKAGIRMKTEGDNKKQLIETRVCEQRGKRQEHIFMQLHLHTSPLKLISILSVNAQPQDCQFTFVCVLGGPYQILFSSFSCAKALLQTLGVFIIEQSKQRSLPSCCLVFGGGDKQQTIEIVNKYITQQSRR